MRWRSHHARRPGVRRPKAPKRAKSGTKRSAEGRPDTPKLSRRRAALKPSGPRRVFVDMDCRSVDLGRAPFDNTVEPNVVVQLSSAGFPEIGTRRAIVRVSGSLLAPIRCDLSHTMAALIRRGERQVLLDLRGLDDVDAAGVGELVRAFNMMRAAGGVLRIAHANGHVRRLLRTAGVFTLLAGGVEA